MKVLVVDDSGTMRKIIIRSLNAVGVTDIVEAGDGQEGVNVFNQHTFQLVMTDWNMPVKNGLDLVRDIRSTGSATPILMVTTEAEKDRVVEAITAGVSDYVIKPFTPETLRTKLDKFVAL